jgi:hypothetical protein
METTHVSETSTLYIHTPGNYPKEDNIRFSQHGESLKTRLVHLLVIYKHRTKFTVRILKKTEQM